MVTLCRCAQVSRVSLCSQRVYSCVWDCVLAVLLVCVWVLYIWDKSGSQRCEFSHPTLSPGMFWPWTAATGNELTFSTFRGTLRWLKHLAAFLFFWTWLLTCPAEWICNLLQGRVVENISKRCGGFLRKLSLRGCLGVGDSALRWDVGKLGMAEVPAQTGPTKCPVFPL